MRRLTTLHSLVDATFVERRSKEIFEQHSKEIHVYVDKMFACLMILQWLAGIFTAIWVSPFSWEGTTSSVHIHVWAAVIGGGILCSMPIYLALTQPGTVLSRQTIAVAQMLFSALLIHLSGGRIETHFHAFGSLAFLAFYRDWRVLLTATAVIGLDHLIRGALYPASVFGVAQASPWRSIEHIAWVLFEDVFLIRSCLQNTREMKMIAHRQAVLEQMNDLHAQEQRFKTLCDLSPLGIFQTDELGQCTFVNSYWVQITGRPAEDAYGEGWQNFIHPDDKSGFAKAWQDSILTGSQLDVDCRIFNASGQVRWVHLLANALWTDKTSFYMFVGTMQDITERKEAETRIAEFYSTVSHELRTPLTSIRGALSLIDEGIVKPDSDEAKELIAIAKSSSIRLIRLINEILDLRKIEAGKLTLNLAPIHSSVLIKAAVDGMVGMSAENKVILQTEMNDDAELLVDLDRMTQVITNLISNAIKFSEPDRTVTVRCSRHGRHQRISVIDQGPGIPKDQQSKLFGLFQQLDSSDSRPKEGTGLGLAISKALVEQHGGTIGVESEFGKGSTFYVDIPLATIATTSTAPVATQPTSCSVLIVEDDQELAAVLKSGLAQANIACETVGTKGECIRFLSGIVPSAILLDLFLPDGHGLEIIEHIRSCPELASVPIIVMSGDAAQREFTLPMVFEFISKPFDQSVMLAAIHRALGQSEAKRVLIVDDDSDVRAVIAAQMKSLNVETLQAGDGREALSILENSSPDLIVLDIGMPHTDGFAVVSWLRDNHRCHIPLLVYSGQDLDAMQKASLSVKLTKHLVKGTASEDEFIQAVKELLSALTVACKVNNATEVQRTPVGV